MKKSNFIKYGLLVTAFLITLGTIIVSSALKSEINESLVYGVFCSVLVATIVEIGNDIRNVINRKQTKTDIMSSARFHLFYLLNHEKNYLALAIKSLTGKKLINLEESSIKQKDIIKSIKDDIEKNEKLYSEILSSHNHIGIDKVTLDKEQNFYKYFCSYSRKNYERLKNDISKLLNNKDFFLSQNIVSKEDINTLQEVEICLGNISENSDFQNISLLIDDKKTFFNDYINKLSSIINYDSKKTNF